MLVRKNGYLLIEVIISLFILSVVALPWLNFLKQQSSTNLINDLNDYFYTKHVLLKAINHQINAGIFKHNSNIIRVQKKSLPSNMTQLTVDFYSKDTLKFSLVGVSK